jgi:hypothetical protein
MRRRLTALLVGLGMLVGLTVAAQPATARPLTPTKSASCVGHYKTQSILGYSPSTSYIYYSNTGWYRSIWWWDSCNGGVYFQLQFQTDCRLHAVEWRVYPNGGTYNQHQIGVRGNSCAAQPGTLRFQKNGAVKTFSAADTELSSTGYPHASPYEWQFFMVTDVSYPYVEERLLQDGFDFWFGPAWNM